MLNIQSIIDYTADNGGGTFNPITGDPLKLEGGYIAAVKNIGSPPIQNDELIATLFEKITALNTVKPVSIGTWLDEYDTLHIDAVNVFREEKDAIRSCVLLDELAYYDVAKGESIENAYSKDNKHLLRLKKGLCVELSLFDAKELLKDDYPFEIRSSFLLLSLK